MKRIIVFLLIVGCVAGLTGCTNEDKAMGSRGYLRIGVENDVTLQTKAAYAASLNVTILDAAEDTVKHITGFDPALNDRIELEAGAYSVVVTSGNRDSAAWEMPFFYGKEECRIVADQLSDVQVVCKIANTKVTVDYSDSFKTYFPEYTATVSNSSGSLVYEKGETRGGFFAAEKLTAVLNLTNTDGRTFVLKRVFPNIEEKTHYNLKFTLEEGSGSNDAGGNFEITVDEEAEMILIRIPIVADELEKMQVPSFRIEGFDAGNSLVLTSGEAPDNSVKVVAPNSIETFRLLIQSDSLNAKGIASFDLANLSESEKVLLESFSFPVQLVKDATDTVTFDLKAMANALVPYDSRVQVHTFTFIVLDKMHQEQTVSFSYQVKPNTGVFTSEMTPAAVWTTFARLGAMTDNQAGLGFEYKEADAVDWTEVSVSSKNADGSFGCLVSELKPHTNYVYRGFSNDDLNGGVRIYGNEVAFTTDYANADENGNAFVPNLDFDDWYKDGKTWYLGLNADVRFWDSGNKGANTLEESNPTAKEEFVVVAQTPDNKAAAKLESKKVNAAIFNVFAAGNIYTGSFVKAVVGLTAEKSGAELDFGQSYKGGRPTKLTGYYNYIPATVNWGSHNELVQGVQDKCAIYVALMDWSAPYRVNTKEKDFVKFDGSDVIAYGELDDTKYVNAPVDQNGYKYFEIDINYRDTKRTPTYILIVASASKYGDYFTGGVGSTLYIDEFELQYDYNPASFAGTELEGLQPANTNN